MAKKIMHIYTPMGETTIVVETEHREVDKCPPLAELQELVGGGLIELVQVIYKGKTCDMIVNEEGLLRNMAFNHPATKAMQATYDGYGHIVGPAIIFEGFKLP